MNEDVRTGRKAYGSSLGAAGGRETQAVALRGDAMAVALYAAPPYAVQVPPLGVTRVSINLSPARVTGGLEGERPRTFLARRHSLFLTPAGAAVAWHKANSSRHINLYFDAGAFDAAEGDACHTALRDAGPLWNTTLGGAGSLIEMLAGELANAQPFGVEAIDSLARLLLARLARQQGRARDRANPLTPPLQQRLAGYIDTHLSRRLLVPELAAVAGLPPNRFAQAFVQATGRSPHQHLLELRLQRALELLRHSDHPLADVAAACGFASQQHMTRLVQRRFGSTPGRQRAQARSRPA